MYTTPSTWKAGSETPILPYSRIVGVETAAGLIACRFALDEKPVPVTLDVPDNLSARVAAFFGTHIADYDPESPASPPGSLPTALRYTMRYNCHVFALAMRGQTVKSHAELEAQIASVRQAMQPFTGNLAAGRHGMIRNPAIQDDPHSFIGLGKAVPLTLQVMDNNGNMGILPYDQLIPRYARHQGGEYMLTA